MKKIHKLTAASARLAFTGKQGDGANLWLIKRGGTEGKWVFYVKVYGRRREMGLGSYPAVSLKEAREEAEKWRAITRQGLDPIRERERLRSEAQRDLHLLREIALDAFESRKAELKGDGKAGRWFSPLEIHILPKLGNTPVSDIDQINIRDTLAPIWHEKAHTASKAINRLGICLKHAAALGLSVDLQAVEKARALLGQQRHRTKNIPALPWAEVPIFYASLNEDTVSHRALRLLILTAVRSGPLRHMHIDQIDGNVWTIPGEALKGRRGATSDFRVPLSDEALRVVDAASKHTRDGFLFPSVRKGVISDATMSRMMERRGMDARPHGFRSSFKDWTSETTTTPYEVSETALGHLVGGSVERAYRRTDYLEQRRSLMQQWSNYATGHKGMD